MVKKRRRNVNRTKINKTQNNFKMKSKENIPNKNYSFKINYIIKNYNLKKLKLQNN